MLHSCLSSQCILETMHIKKSLLKNKISKSKLKIPWALPRWPCCCWACGPSAGRWGHSYRGPPGSPHVCGSWKGTDWCRECCRDALLQSSFRAEIKSKSYNICIKNIDQQHYITIKKKDNWFVQNQSTEQNSQFARICSLFTFLIWIFLLCYLGKAFFSYSQ